MAVVLRRLVADRANGVGDGTGARRLQPSVTPADPRSSLAASSLRRGRESRPSTCAIRRASHLSGRRSRDISARISSMAVVNSRREVARRSRVPLASAGDVGQHAEKRSRHATVTLSASPNSTACTTMPKRLAAGRSSLGPRKLALSTPSVKTSTIVRESSSGFSCSATHTASRIAVGPSPRSTRSAPVISDARSSRQRDADLRPGSRT